MRRRTSNTKPPVSLTPNSSTDIPALLDSVIECVDIFFLLDQDHRIIKWNRKAEELFQRNDQELLFAPFEKMDLFIEAKDYTVLFEKLERQGSFRDQFQLRSTQNVGFMGWVTASLCSLDNNREGVVLVITDITDQLETSQSLIRANRHISSQIAWSNSELTSVIELENVIDHQNQMISIFQPGQIIFQSSTATLLLGWPEDKLWDWRFFENLIHPQDNDRFNECRKLAIASPGEPFYLQIRFKTGGKKFLMLEGTLVDQSSNPMIRGIVLNLHDPLESMGKQEIYKLQARELAEKEHFLQLMINHSPAAVAMFDRDMRYMVASRRWISDYSLEGMDLIGRSHYEVFPEIINEWKAIHQACLHGEAAKREDDSFVRMNGSTMQLRWEVQPWRNGEGEIGGLVIFTEDITVLKQREETIQEEEERYRTIVDRISDGFIALDRNWNFTFANQAAAQLFNSSCEELVGKNIWKLAPNAVHNSFYNAYHLALEKQENVFIEDYSEYLKRWVHASIYPSPSGLSIFYRDVTRERNAERAIRKSEELRKSIMRAALDAIVCVDAKSRISFWNAQAAALFGWQESEVLGRNLTGTIIPLRHQHGHEAGMARIEETGEAHVIGRLLELSALKKTGEEFPIEIFIVQLAEESGHFYCAFIRDISKRKISEHAMLRSEARLKQAQAIAHLGHWEMNLKNKMTSWSEEACRIYGITPTQEWFSLQQWLSYVVPQDLKKVTEMLNLRSHSPDDSPFTFRIKRADGKFRNISLQSQLEFDAAGKAVSLYGILHDITEFTNLQNELRIQQTLEQLKLTAAMLKAQENERNAIGRELHDNVNQLLAATKLSLSMVQSMPDKTEFLIQQSIDRIQLAIMENRRLSHELVAPDFSEEPLTNRLAELLHSMLSPAAIECLIDFHEFEEKRLTTAEKLAIYRIVQEQCTNIIKYAKASTTSLTLRTDNHRCYFDFHDDGKGIEKGAVSDGIGINNIKSRVSLLSGNCSIITATGQGFKLLIDFPLTTNAD